MRVLKMKKLHYLVLAVFALSVLSGCSYFNKSKKGGVDGAQTSAYEDQDSFGGDGIFEANKLKPAYNQRYLFGFDKYEVMPCDMGSIEVQAEYLMSHPKATVRLEGNADERGSREYNIALGWKRARAVADALKQEGVKSDQIIMVSYGKEKPIAFGHDEDAHSKNRRTDLIYESK